MSKHMSNHGNHGNHMPMMPHDGHRHGDHMPHDASNSPADHEPVPSDDNIKDMENPVMSHGSGDGDGGDSTPADQLSVKPHDDGQDAAQMPVMPNHDKVMPMVPHDDMPMMPNGGIDHGSHRPMKPHGDNHDVHRPMMPHGSKHDHRRPAMPHGSWGHGDNKPMMGPKGDDYNNNDD